MSVLTNVDMVNDILRELDITTVTASDDSRESTKVWYHIKSTFDDLIVRRRWDFLNIVSRLDSASDTATKKIKLLLPLGATTVHCVKYDKVITTADPDWVELTFLEPCDFLEKVQRRKLSDSNVESIAGPDSVPLHIINDTGPTYFTRWPDEKEGTDGEVRSAIWFDAYDAGEATTLEVAKTSIQAFVVPVFQDDIANASNDTQQIPARVFPVLLGEAKIAAFLNFKQDVSPKLVRDTRKLLTVMREEDVEITRERSFKNYGKNSRKQTSRRPHFRHHR